MAEPLGGRASDQSDPCVSHGLSRRSLFPVESWGRQPWERRYDGAAPYSRAGALQSCPLFRTSVLVSGKEGSLPRASCFTHMKKGGLCMCVFKESLPTPRLHSGKDVLERKPLPESSFTGSGVIKITSVLSYTTGAPLNSTATGRHPTGASVWLSLGASGKLCLQNARAQEEQSLGHRGGEAWQLPTFALLLTCTDSERDTSSL